MGKKSALLSAVDFRQPVFLIGGGPSAGKVDLEALRGVGTVVAINDCMRKLPWADVVFSADPSWMWKRLTEWRKFVGARVFAIPHTERIRYQPEAKGVVFIHRLEGAGISKSPDICYFSDNSGFGALSFVVAHGARRVCLIGYDMKPGHWHDGYEWQTIAQRLPEKWDLWKSGFDIVAPKMRDHGVDIVNLNPESAIRCFRFDTLENFLGA